MRSAVRGLYVYRAAECGSITGDSSTISPRRLPMLDTEPDGELDA